MSGNPNILLVEDDDLVRRSITITLQSSGYAVTQAPDVTTASTLIGETPFDLVVTDVWMPGQTGIDLLKSVRASGGTMPFVFISGGNSSEPLELTIGRAEAHGAVNFLMKPFEDDELIAAIKRALPTRPDAD